MELAKQGTTEDVHYQAFLQRVSGRFVFNSAGRPVFMTDAAEDLWTLYIESFPEGAERQHHTCNACRHFIQRYGALVTIDADGKTLPVMWELTDAYGPYMQGVARLMHRVGEAKVTGVFLHASSVLGHPVTGEWQHLHATNPKVFYSPTQSAGQAMAEKREDFKNVKRALAEFTPATVQTAMQLLTSEALYRAEKVIGPARWLGDLHAAIATKQGAARDNAIWLAIATAPAGYAHPRSSMIGTLLEDIAAGMTFDQVSKRFAAKMNPTAYQRTTAAPRAGQIDAAERAVEALGIAPAFARCYATEAEIATAGVLWQPSEVRQAAAPAAPAAAGVFDHLKPAPAAAPVMDIPPKTITWEKFAREALPGAAKIEYRVPLVGPFCALTAAVDPEAPPILQWDEPERRNTASWSFPNPPARAEEWSLEAGSLVPVQIIVNTPNQWHDAERYAQHGKGVILMLEGAKDTRDVPGGGLFMEHLRSDLKPYRSTIEAHMNRMKVVHVGDAHPCAFGIGLMAGHEFTETAAPKIETGSVTAASPDRVHVILVVDDSGSMASYISAARGAMRQLLNAVRSMPGIVDVTFVKFGDYATMITDRMPLDHLEGAERHMNARSGNTALNDTLIEHIRRAQSFPDAQLPGTSFFLGVVTDGEENHSHRSIGHVAATVRAAIATGRWTIAFAGAGYNARAYARDIGVPDGNITTFEASVRGFEDVGTRYAASTQSLGAAYARGAKSSTTFFAAAPGAQAMGTDHPVLLVTNKSGSQNAYAIDRWD